MHSKGGVSIPLNIYTMCQYEKDDFLRAINDHCFLILFFFIADPLSKRNRYQVDIISPVSEPYTKRVKEWCLPKLTKCTKIEHLTREVNRTETVTRTRFIQECCGSFSSLSFFFFPGFSLHFIVVYS